MNRVLADIEATGETLLPTGERVPVHSHVPPAAGALIRRAVALAAPALALEVGLAFGVSTLHILDALAAGGGGRLVGMDPAQNDATWRGGGLHNVRRSGHADRYEFHEESSQVLLPRLAAAGTRIQFALIDGWHTFDHVLVDFFFADRMLEPGGVIVLDDVGYPSIRRFCHFAVTNRDYTLVDSLPRETPRSWRAGLKRAARRALLPVVRDDLTPGPAARALEREIDGSAMVALRKNGEDRRRFDHFAPF